MYVDINQIPSMAIQRVEVISGGASAVYGADAVGGVLNFILKDDFEGASVEMRVGDTQHGGNQEILLSGLLGANVAGDRGNVMFGVERATRTKVQQWERDWRVDDMRNPATNATAFFWGSDTWISSTAGDPNFDALNIFNLPDQNAVNELFSEAADCTANPDIPAFLGAISGHTAGTCPMDANGVPLGVPNNVRMLLNRSDGTIYTGLMESAGAAGSYRYNGPLGDTGDSFGNFPGLPFRIRQPDGTIKENNFWQWNSSPTERISAFAKGHFDVSDEVRITGQMFVSRTEGASSLGLIVEHGRHDERGVPARRTVRPELRRRRHTRLHGARSLAAAARGRGAVRHANAERGGRLGESAARLHQTGDRPALDGHQVHDDAGLTRARRRVPER
jgi:iron complex outermembrane receptor protein